MPEIMTSLFKTDLARLFYQEVQDSNYYVFVSSLSPDRLNRIDAANTLVSKNQFLDTVLYGKRVENSDTKFMIKYNPWQNGNFYEQYDDSVSLEGVKFTAVVGPNLNDTGDYRVYKCLFNNNNGSVSTQPDFDPENVSQIYRTADGYIWKYLYRITQAEFEAYNSNGYIPIMGDFPVNAFDEHPNNANTYVVQSTSLGSPIDQIFVTNVEANAGYPKATGKIKSPVTQGGEIDIEGSLEFPLNEITDYYVGMSLVITKSATETVVYTVSGYTYDINTERAIIQVSTDDDPYSDGVGTNNTYQLLPRVKITGDGSGALAYPILNNGIITDILVINPGSNYVTVNAEIVDPIYDFNPSDALSTDIKATVRAVLSPPTGHNTNIVEELACRHVLLYGYITETDNLQIGDSNSYSHIGYVKNPEWETANTDLQNPRIFDNRIAITTDDFGSAVVDDLVSQVDADNNVIFNAQIHEVDASSNTIYLYNYNRGFPNANSTVDTALDYTKDITTSAGLTIEINSPVADNIQESPYTQSTGHVYFMEDFVPLDRTPQSREEFKLVVEF